MGHADPAAYGLPRTCEVVAGRCSTHTLTFRHPDGHFTAVVGRNVGAVPSLTIDYTTPEPTPAPGGGGFAYVYRCDYCDAPIPVGQSVWDEVPYTTEDGETGMDEFCLCPDCAKKHGL